MTSHLDLALANIRNVREALSTTVQDRQLDPLRVAIAQIMRHQHDVQSVPTSEPEIVTGAQAQDYPDGSQFVRVDPNNHDKVAVAAAIVTVGGRFGSTLDSNRDAVYRVLYRAPEAEPKVEVSFHVGDHLHNDMDVFNAPVGIVVRTANGGYARKTNLSGPWAGFNGVVMTAFIVGAEIIDLPDA